MMRATGAKLRMLASDAVALLFVFLGVVCGGEVDECGDEDDMAPAAGLGSLRYTATLSGSRRGHSCARLEGMSASRSTRWQQSVDVQMERSSAQIRQQEGVRNSIRTIGDWEPSVLLLDFEFVPESLGLCVCAFSVHVCLFSVRRLDWCDIVLRYSVFGHHGPLQLLWRGRHASVVVPRGSVCAGGLRSYSLASTSLGTMGWLGGRVCDRCVTR